MAISAILAGLSLKKILANRWVLLALSYIILATSMYMVGRLHQWKVDAVKDLKKTNESLIEHIEKKDEVKRHYERRFKDECILSGRVSMNSKKGCKE